MRLLVPILVLLLTSSLAGCFGDTSDPPDPPETDDDAAQDDNGDDPLIEDPTGTEGDGEDGADTNETPEPVDPIPEWPAIWPVVMIDGSTAERILIKDANATSVHAVTLVAGADFSISRSDLDDASSARFADPSEPPVWIVLLNNDDITPPDGCAPLPDSGAYWYSGDTTDKSLRGVYGAGTYTMFLGATEDTEITISFANAPMDDPNVTTAERTPFMTTFHNASITPDDPAPYVADITHDTEMDTLSVFGLRALWNASVRAPGGTLSIGGDQDGDTCGLTSDTPVPNTGPRTIRSSGLTVPGPITWTAHANATIAPGSTLHAWFQVIQVAPVVVV